MMNFDNKKQAKEIIEKILTELDSESLNKRYDEQVMKVAEEFDCNIDCPLDHKDFHKVIADFVQHIYQHALRKPFMLTNSLDEAIMLLENGYRSTLYGPGYYGAILQANDQAGGGIQLVLTDIAELLINNERQKYINSVLTSYLHSCSWDLLCQIAKKLLDDYQRFLPPQLYKCATAQIVDVIPDIIYGDVCSEQIMKRLSIQEQQNTIAEQMF